MQAELLAAIAAAPDDDAPRLVYGDWLTERGDPQGELIAIQCRLARGVGPWTRRDLERRERELIARMPALPAGEPIYRRGLLEGVRIHPLDLLATPLPPLALLHVHVRHDVPGEKLAELLRVLAGSTVLAGFRELDASWMRRALDALCDPACRARPRRLVLPAALTDEANLLSSADAARIAAAPLCSQLAELDLSAVADDAALAVILAAPFVGGLHTLRLGPGRGILGPEPGPISARGIAALAAHPRLANLRVLDLRSHAADAGAIDALAASPLALDELLLSVDALGLAGLAALAGSRLAGCARL